LRTLSKPLALAAALSLGAVACGDSDGTNDAGTRNDDGGGRPTVVVTTNILGDVVDNLVGDQAEVVVIMPVGADPHDFQASAQQVASIGDADALIVNGAGFEVGLLDVMASADADGVPTFAAMSAVRAIGFGDAGDDHRDEAHDEDEGFDHGGTDPHFFTDPDRMATAAEAIAGFLVDTLEGVEREALEASAAAYVTELRALDGDVEAMLAEIPDERRVLVTNHEVFGYFADRYGFEVVGTIIPGGSTADAGSAAALVELAEIIEHEGVPAIFADTSSSDELAQTLAAEVGDVAVVELYSESLGSADSDGASYVAMVRTNAERILGALRG